MRQWLISQIVDKVAECRQKPPHKVWLDHQLDTLLWFWSVDRVVNGTLVRNAIAPGAGNGTGFDFASYTHAARTSHHGLKSKLIIRDHTVPKKVIRRMLLASEAEGIAPEQIERLLDRYCFIVFIHKDEDQRLKDARLSQQMPQGWESAPRLQRDPWARYRKVGLLENVVRHKDAPPF